MMNLRRTLRLMVTTGAIASGGVFPAPAGVAAQQIECGVQLRVESHPGAMIGLSLLAPCHPDQRVVVKHAGLAITARTSAGGALETVLPGLSALAEVRVTFADGQTATAQASLTDFGTTRRFAVQWHDRDAFQVHAFEDGAGYGQPGHISAGVTGALIRLGDASVALPLLAEVFTFAPGKTTDLIVEAAVTAETCGRDTLAETIHAVDGTVQISELVMAMPGCDAVGDILMLKNPFADRPLAAAH